MFVVLTGIIRVKVVFCVHVLGGSTVRGTTGSTLKRCRSQSAVSRPSATKQRYIYFLFYFGML